MAKQRSGTVAKAARVLDEFLDAPGGLTLSQLAQRTGLHKSSILRLCNALTDAGLLERDAALTYRVGPRVAQLAQNYDQQVRLEDLVRPILAQLRDRIGESAGFHIRDGDAQLCLYREHARSPLRHHRDEGARLPLEEDVTGRVLRAFAGDGASAVAEAGYACTVDDHGLGAVAVPVTAAGGTLHGALMLAGPAYRFDWQQREAALAELEAAAHRLAERLSGCATTDVSGPSLAAAVPREPAAAALSAAST